MKRLHLIFLLALQIPACAFSQTFVLESGHSFPSFETDHFGGVSTWRGKFNKMSGKGFIDVARKTGDIEVAVDMDSVNIGNVLLDKELKSSKFFDIARYPLAIYKGTLTAFNENTPTQVQGTLTLHGVTRPVSLNIETFKCFRNPMIRREVCGAEVSGTFNRDEFGIDYGKAYGFLMVTKLHLQVEAIMNAPAQ